ncbi:MAG: hypothetical protein ACRDNW_20040 [Trebonia sp.]
MPRDRARKKAIRPRMAASGEPYSVAARKLDAAPPPGDAVAREVGHRSFNGPCAQAQPQAAAWGFIR